MICNKILSWHILNEQVYLFFIYLVCVCDIHTRERLFSYIATVPGGAGTSRLVQCKHAHCFDLRTDETKTKRCPSQLFLFFSLVICQHYGQRAKKPEVRVTTSLPRFTKLQYKDYYASLFFSRPLRRDQVERPKFKLERSWRGQPARAVSGFLNVPASWQASA